MVDKASHLNQKLHKEYKSSIFEILLVANSSIVSGKSSFEIHIPSSVTFIKLFQPLVISTFML
jgi:hypothetical protein